MVSPVGGRNWAYTGKCERVKLLTLYDKYDKFDLIIFRPPEAFASQMLETSKD
jgi:hypothetical protein